MILEIITPNATLYSGNIKRVNLPGSTGSFELLDGHAPIISTLQEGKIVVIEESGNEILFSIKGGVIEQSSNKINILVE